MEIKVSTGYLLKDEGVAQGERIRRLIRVADGVGWDVRNRGFYTINRQFGQLLLKTITQLTEVQDQVRILDIGGGSDSRSVTEIRSRFGNKVAVYNVDPIAIVQDPGNNVFATQAEAEKLPFLDNTFDLAYSFQFFPYYVWNKTPEGEIKALEEVTRVLKPGGKAIIDEWLLSYKSSGAVRKTLQGINASFEFKKAWLYFPLNLLLFSYNPFRSLKTLVLTKKEV